MAVIFGIVGLIVTIPLHLIYSAVKGNNKSVVAKKQATMTYAQGWKDIKDNKKAYTIQFGSMLLITIILTSLAINYL
jgi:hypothetical protein